MLRPHRRLGSFLAGILLLSAAPMALAQEGGEGPPPDQPVTVIVRPGTQGVVGFQAVTKFLIVNLSKKQDSAIRYFWLYNAEVPPEGASISLRAGEVKTFDPPTKKVGDQEVPPSTFLLFNNGGAMVSVHKLGD